MYPYIVFLLSFSVWSNFMYELRKTPGYIYPNYAITGVLVAFCLYFARGEIRQFNIAGWYYFLDPWNYLDILPLALVTSTCIWTTTDELMVQYFDANTYTDIES